MVSDATKKYREIFAYGLLGVAALYFISGLSLLFKSGDDLGDAGFADKSALFGYIFSHPLLVISLFGAVALATAWEDNSKNAKTIVLIALGSARCRCCSRSSAGSPPSARTRGPAAYSTGSPAPARWSHLPRPGAARLARPRRVLRLHRLPDFPKPVRHSTSRASGVSSRPAGASAAGLGPAAGGYGQGRRSRVGASSRAATTSVRRSRLGASSRAAYDQGQAQQGWGQQPAGATTRTRPSGGAASTGAGPAWGDQSSSQAEQQGQPAASWGQSDPSTTGQPAGWGDQSAAAPETPSGWGHRGSTPATPAHEADAGLGRSDRGPSTTPEATPGETAATRRGRFVLRGGAQ